MKYPSTATGDELVKWILKTQQMKGMKNSDIRALSVAELTDKISIEREALRKMQFAHQVTAIENPMKLRESRKLVARLKTELSAKELQK
jgi:large subunit ribosomal protein L29